jgi:hypothetical protein
MTPLKFSPLRFFVCFLVLHLCAAKHSFAANDKLKVNGFATLGAIYNDSDDLGFRANLKTPGRTGFSLAPDSLIGLQANINVSAKWDAMVQAVYRDKLDKKAINYLDVAFLRYRLNSRWEFRGGRMNTDIYFLSEYNSVGYAYLWARPPAEFYSKVTAVSQFEGGDVLYKRTLGEGFFTVKLGYGETDTTIATTGDGLDVNFTNMLMASASYQQNNWQIRASFLDAKVDQFGANLDIIDEAIALFPPSIWPGGPEIRERFDFVGKKQQFYGLGYRFDNDQWLLQTEIGFINSQWDIDRDTISGYISLGYQNNGMTYFATISAVEPTENNLSDSVGEISPEAPAAVAALIQSFSPLIRDALEQNVAKQHTFSLGAKWILSASLVAKLQLDHSVISGDDYAFWRVFNEPSADPKVNVASLSLNWVF